MQFLVKYYLIFATVFVTSILSGQVLHDSVAPSLLNRGSVTHKKCYPVQGRIFRLVSEYSKKFRVNSNLILAIIHTESNFNRLAVSPKGAQGLMQIMPETFRELNGTDPFDLSENIRCGIRYFCRQLSAFKNIRLALAAYNAGPNAVKNGIPKIRETRNYIEKILACHQKFSYTPKKEE